MVKRKGKIEKLSKQPLALVLIQIRFTPFMNMKDYIPQIQEKLLTLGFVNCIENPCLEVQITPSGPRSSNSKQWVFSSFDGYENVILDSNQLTYQTANYDVFEEYYAKYQLICNIITSSAPNFETSVLIQRLGLRYIDRIIPMNEEDSIDSYISEGFKVNQASIFGSANKICTISQAGVVNIFEDKNGAVVFRITQGEKGLFLPPDLMPNPPKMKKEFAPDCLIGLIDIDHSYNAIGPEKFNKNFLENMFYGMHDNSHDLFMSIVSEEGKEKWK
jgi:uncharacterized protein (TIGR04255 family)